MTKKGKSNKSLNKSESDVKTVAAEKDSKKRRLDEVPPASPESSELPWFQGYVSG